ncbi:hypothetical protein Barb6_02506 [Bacteroidales bacterium Barb6]|nr:hypothetical protein Barb6_02506 [Bacteroidales bacterium Barb6]
MYRKVEAFAFSDKCWQLSDIKAWDKPVEVGASFIDFMKEELRRRNYPALTRTVSAWPYEKQRHSEASRSLPT